MKFLRFVPIQLTLFLVLGIVIGKGLSLSVPQALVFNLASLGILAFLFFSSKKRTSLVFGIVVALTTVGIGLLAQAKWNPKNWKHHYSHFIAEEGNSLRLKIHEELKSNTYSERYIALVEETNGRKSSGKIILSLPIDSANMALQVDHELLVFGSLHDLMAPRNPHQFDYRNYLNGMGVYHELRSTKDAYYVAKNYTRTMYGIAAAARKKIITTLQGANFGQDELSIIQALLLGQRNSISAETYEHYKDAGAVHILAVSGLHIGIILLLLQFLLKPLERLPKGKILKLIVIVLLLWCFALLAGLSPSVVRAVSMFSFVAYALYLNRPSNTFNILALSMFFILLLFNPMLLFQVGFQMSYAAVFAIIWIYPMLQRFWNPKKTILKKVWQLLSVSMAAQLGVLPISLYYFHQFPGLFFVSNLLIVPFLGVLLGLGILVILLALINLLPDVLVKVYNQIIGLMNSVVEWVAHQEAFVFKNIAFDQMQMLLTYAVIITLVAVCAKTSFKRTATFLIALISFQSYIFYSEINTLQKKKLVLLHQSKNSILLYQKGNELSVYARKEQGLERLITNYMIGERIAATQKYPLKNSYFVEDKKLFILDSSALYASASVKTDFLLLTQSPKINLERVLDSLKPEVVLADGSNYTSYIKRWKATCNKKKLTFHYTGEKGAYYFE